ncbi:chromosome partitioning protein ParB [Candidatus Shapirobacteria bacterium CG08_land_8_20_14_0_20_39_18]|uniref:Chromosome partitioning protein ParB n=1 Tax=Candidatus Shapirobacteria bacterium CG08_land_8_20_14_0_20_39_18 TaxID=1974883 RepID=A0A2M6XBU6_9BACT|nr:MAG: chromosome partitioning protein ParB [Candidatus Shapirobacteria bacterium CG08_land_8_20_14_0_20_39_18]PIY65333.1 MAG: chromosome partitioning protein ParB [Candidatus Shapirobacteria bacterium CG_4_10_14_0_8_um_filter_39_15]PJE68486.1 MAG: chromosome partitioning protein ParB [Candidatus Shapirobacteria bacterium CG10_big_fil_rev_8_21_14_0_10_38_8]
MAENQQVIQLDINELQGNPLQPRGVITPESLVDLVDSIKQHGILEPLVVAKTPAGYQLVAGERRWRAAKIAGLAYVPVIIKETTPRGMLEMAIVENVQRVDLNPIERAKAFQRLIEEFSLGTSEISRRIGKSQAYVSNSLRILTLPDALKDGLLSGLISEGHARALAAIEDPRVMIEAYKIILKEAASVRRAEDIARRMKYSVGEEAKRNKVQVFLVHEEADRMRNEMEKKLVDDGAKAKVKITRSRAETKITFTLKGGLEDTDGTLLKIYKAVCKE